MTMDLKLDEETLRDVVHDAILRQLGDDAREKVIAAAITHLMTPAKDGYYKGETPLQQSFNQAVGKAANSIVFEMVEQDEEFKSKLREQVGAAFVAMESTNFTEYFGSALSDALKRGGLAQ